MKENVKMKEYREALRELQKLQKAIANPFGFSFSGKLPHPVGVTPVKRLGLDIHGVITLEPTFLSAKAAELVSLGHEVHIMSGARYTEETILQLLSYGFVKDVHYTHYFSITDHLIDTGAEVSFSKGMPTAEAFLWDSAKGEYALTKGIHCLWDDSPVYGRYMPEGCWYFTFHKDNFESQLDQVLNGTRPKVGRK